MSDYKIRLEMSLKNGGTLLRALQRLSGDLSPAQEEMYAAFVEMLAMQHQGAGFKEPKEVRPKS